MGALQDADRHGSSTRRGSPRIFYETRIAADLSTRRGSPRIFYETPIATDLYGTRIAADPF